MDFGTLLHKAQKNEQSTKNEVRYYSTKFEPPKKEKKTSRELSANIKKFLAKKEAEERKRLEEEKRKREELLALRSQDKKATRRVNVMLKRTKSANQSVIDDAVDKDNTAVTLAGPLQPDEDDYGYVSQEASAFYNKMMEKYSKIPDEPKFSFAKKKMNTNLSGTKDRVKAALEKEKEEAEGPHRRKRKHTDKKEEEDVHDEEEGNNSRSGSKEEKPERKQKPKIQAAPVINFTDLLKIAEKKQHEPIMLEKKEKEEETLMTKKQKREYEREKESRQRREERWREYNSKGSHLNEKSLNTIKDKPSSKIESSKSVNNKNRPVGKEGLKVTSRDLSGDVKARSDEKKNVPAQKGGEDKLVKKYLPGDIRYKGNVSQESNSSKQLPKNIPKRNSDEAPQIAQRKYLPGDIRAKNSDIPSVANQKKYLPGDIRNKSVESKPVNVPKLNKTPMENSKLSSKVPVKSLKPKQFPPPDLQPRERPVSVKKPVIGTKRRILDDDDEYDSEMDDFIDDNDAEDDYSKYISEIFGYDKSRYRDVEDDVDNMESSFAQQMREEVISTKIGIMEDLEDMKQEEEAKKRKKLLMQKHKKKM